MTDFKHDPTRRRNHVSHPSRQAPVDREPIRAAVKSFDRIEIADLRLETVEIRSSYIRRICNQHMEGAGDVFKSVCV